MIELTKRMMSRWNEKEDARLIALLADDFLGRTDVQCLHRWQNVIDCELVKGPSTKEENDCIIKMEDSWTKQDDSLLAYYHQMYGNNSLKKRHITQIIDTTRSDKICFERNIDFSRYKVAAETYSTKLGVRNNLGNAYGSELRLNQPISMMYDEKYVVLVTSYEATPLSMLSLGSPKWPRSGSMTINTVFRNLDKS
ncbi:Transcription factor MYB3R-4 [Bienertia sinuspersici]